MKFLYAIILLISFNSNAQTDVLMSDFQTGIPVNYSMLNLDDFTVSASVSEYTSAWISKEDPDDALNFVASSTSDFNPAGQANRWLITPQLTLGSFGNFLTWQSKSHDATFPDTYYVLVSKTDNQVASFTDTLKFVFQTPVFWRKDSVNLSGAGLDGESIYLAFALRTYDGFKLYLDSVHVWKEDPVSVNQISTIEFTLYPNPTNDLIHISTKSDIEALRIFDLQGKVVLEGKGKQISLLNLKSGSYFLEVQSEGIRSRKLIHKN